jgi:DNA-binding response OmpR family regulator
MSTWNVLVVDDDEDIVRIMKLYLLGKGYDVLTAFSGQEGIDKAKAEKPDLIIVDAMMPGMDGFQTIEQLRGDEATKEIPIIMCTARSARGEVVRAAQLGVKNYVVKPFAGAVLLQKVREVLFPTDDSDAYNPQDDGAMLKP